jgi:nitrile hydratase beta subunit
VNGIHDMGGMDGFGPVEIEPDEPVFHQRWEARVFGMNLFFTGNVDAGRHTIECIAPAEYLSLPYYGRWLRSLETRLALRGVLAAGELEARIAGRPFPSGPPPAPLPPVDLDARREVERAPAFCAGQRVRARNWQPRGHTRLPGYARGRRGVIAIVHPAFVFPDTNAHDRGENPEHVYSVRFEGTELWGDAAEPATCVHLDCFESYLEADR